MIRIFALILMLPIVTTSCGPKTVNDKFPGPWTQEISRMEATAINNVLMKNKLTACPEAYLRRSIKNTPTEYLLACMNDEGKWHYYIVNLSDWTTNGPFDDEMINHP